MLTFKDLQNIKALAIMANNQDLVKTIENLKQGYKFSFCEIAAMVDTVELEAIYLRGMRTNIEKMIHAKKENACIYDFEEDVDWMGFDKRLEACNALKEKIENVEF